MYATGLRRRLSRVMLLAFSLAFVVVAAAVAIYEQTTFKPRMLDTLERQTRTLAAVLLPTLEFDDVETAQSYLEMQRAYPSVAAIGLYSAKGARVAGFVRDTSSRIEWPAKPRQNSHSFVGRELQLWQSIASNDRTIGYLFVTAEAPPLFARLPQYGIMVAAITLALFAVGAVLMRGVRQHVLEPLDKLTETTSHVTRHKDYSVRAPTSGPDEVAHLAAALNQMLETVQERDTALATRVQQEAAVVQLGMDAFAVRTLGELLQRAADVVGTTLRADFVSIVEMLPGGEQGKLVASMGWPSPVSQSAPIAIHSGMLSGRTLLDGKPLLVTDLASDPRFSDVEILRRFGVVSSIGVAILGPTAPWGVLLAHCKLTRFFSEDDVRFMQAIANLLAQAIQRERADVAHASIESQLRQSQKMEALGRLAGGIAHDFNNLLSAILGNAQLARQDVGESNAAMVSLNEIRIAGQRARELVQRILAFSRQQEPHRARLDAVPLVEEAVRLLRATLPAGIELHTHYIDDVPPILADPAQIMQALMNLGTNAWQAIAGRAGRIDISIDTAELDRAWCERHPPTVPGRYVCIRVRDSGVGLDGAIQDRIFEPFFTTKPVGEGTGLGLSVVHGIMQAHGGAITVESEAGKGATFSLYFAALKAGEAEIRAIAPQRDAPSVGTGQEIMYVDDEEPLVFLVTRLLERLGYRVRGFINAEEAIAAYRAEPLRYEMVITDLSMPGMSGMDVARTIMSIRPQAKVLMVSGYLKQTDLVLARSIGVRDVVLKPNTVEELGAAVGTWLKNA
jgi:signal transduction histidine kinase/ActR/RegA family two-component response regulator/HAMP domain-containing protein